MVIDIRKKETNAKGFTKVEQKMGHRCLKKLASKSYIVIEVRSSGFTDSKKKREGVQGRAQRLPRNETKSQIKSNVNRTSPTMQTKV